MFESPTNQTGSRWRIAGSVALHAAVLAVLLHSSHSVRIRTYLPGTQAGSRIELTYLPSRGSTPAPPAPHKPSPVAPSKTSVPAAKTPDLELSRVALPTLPPAATNQPAPEAHPAPAGESSTSSNDALGTDNIQIALTTYSPSPRPDLSRLPHGTHGDVIIDITIDPTGKVADLQILQALGYGVESMVADTVRTWKFQPATRDGVPVASVQELHFHFGSG